VRVAILVSINVEFIVARADRYQESNWHTTSSDIAALDAIQGGNQRDSLHSQPVQHSSPPPAPTSSAPAPSPAAQTTPQGAKVIALIHDLLLDMVNSQASMNQLAAELATDAETADGSTLFGSVLDMERLAQAQCKILLSHLSVQVVDIY